MKKNVIPSDDWNCNSSFLKRGSVTMYILLVLLAILLYAPGNQAKAYYVEDVFGISIKHYGGYTVRSAKEFVFKWESFTMVVDDKLIIRLNGKYLFTAAQGNLIYLKSDGSVVLEKGDGASFAKEELPSK